MYISFEIFLFLIFGFKTFCNSKVILKLRIYNYENEKDIKHDGRKCENFHLFKDYCDPMFRICVSSNYKCDIFSYTIDHWKNKKYVNNVLARTITLEKMERSFAIEVKIDDHDRFDGHDHIAMFNLRLQIARMNKKYAEAMIVTPNGIDVKLIASIEMSCADNYYGKNCDKICLPKLFNYYCNPDTGSRICTINCGLYGVCDWQKESKEFRCECNKGWTGDRCQFSNYTNCINLNCNKKCNDTKEIRYCSCIIGHYVRRCRDPIQVTSTKVLLTQVTSRLNTSKTIMSTKTIPFIAKNTTYRRSNRKTIKLSKLKIIKRMNNSIEIKGKGNQYQASFSENGFSAITVIIICLLLLLCVCVISLSVVIRSWKKKDNSKVNKFLSSFYSQRPLPPVVYTPRPLNDMSEVPLINFYNDCIIDQDIYEEPIINSMTFETNNFDDEDNNSGEYEVPFK